MHRSQASKIIRDQLIPVSEEPELRLITEHGTLTAQVSITRPNPTTGLVEEQTKISAASASDIYIETTQMMLETSQKDKPESGGQTQKKTSTNPRKRASSETEIYDSTKRVRLSDNSRKDDPAEELTKPNTKKDLETSKSPRHRKKRAKTNQLLIMFMWGYLQHYVAISSRL